MTLIEQIERQIWYNEEALELFRIPSSDAQSPIRALERNQELLIKLLEILTETYEEQ